jgi:hypothetical protein
VKVSLVSRSFLLCLVPESEAVHSTAERYILQIHNFIVCQRGWQMGLAIMGLVT